MGLLSSKFAADLQRAKDELELVRQTLTADIARMTHAYNMSLCLSVICFKQPSSCFMNTVLNC